MNRTQQILVGVLAVQIVLILLMRAPFSGSTSSAEKVPLFPDLEQVVATRLQFDGEENETLTLEKRGDDWVVKDVGGYPADGGKIAELLATLSRLEVRRPVVSSGRYHKAFQVGENDNQGRVRVWGDDDAPAADLILGNSPNYRALNVRRAGEDGVYEVRDLASYDVSAKPSFWVEKQLVEVPEAELIGIRVTNVAGTIELERQDGAWVATAPASLVGRELDASRVDALVRQARSIRIDDPVGIIDGAEQGFDDVVTTVVLRWQPGHAAASADDGDAAVVADDEGVAEDIAGADMPTSSEPRELTIRIGGAVADQESQVYVTRAGFDFASTVWTSSVQALIERKADEMLPAPDAPESADET